VEALTHMVLPERATQVSAALQRQMSNLLIWCNLRCAQRQLIRA